ncbi:MAG: hypothetical protein H7Y12_13650 [Sphingobacteriaceae bacterium]|nr:hypothetical protein [Cytophagaceae bacterium]
MKPASLPRQLLWGKNAFSRKVYLKADNETVGSLRSDAFSSDVEARLNGTHLRFDVRGILNQRVELQDSANQNAVLGAITFGWNHHNATLTLVSGECYSWKRQDWLTRQWSLSRPGTDADSEVVHYTKLREFFSTEGTLELLESSPKAEILILTGLFVWIYFQEQATAVMAATA